MGRRKTPRCEVTNCPMCQNKRPGSVLVCENIGDGAFNAMICVLAARALSVTDGDTLPEPDECQRRFREAKHKGKPRGAKK